MPGDNTCTPSFTSSTRGPWSVLAPSSFTSSTGGLWSFLAADDTGYEQKYIYTCNRNGPYTMKSWHILMYIVHVYMYTAYTYVHVYTVY